VDGKTREDIVDRAIKERKERRANVFIAAPFTHGNAQDDHTRYPKNKAERAVILAALQLNFVFSSLKVSDCESI
jgi:hypothetical protein